MSLVHLPIVPTSVLRRHHVHQPLDTRFRACARLLQSVWRTNQSLPMGSYTSRSGVKRRLGSRISARAGDMGANFLTPSIACLARKELAYREPGALIEEQRLWTNLLSSQPLTFNLLGPLRLDLSLGSKVLRGLLPDFGPITLRALLFEHSPGRQDAELTADATAWDACFIYSRPDGRHGFVAVEVKYAEAPGGAGRGLDTTNLIDTSDLFQAPVTNFPRGLCQQLVREHRLAEAYLPTSHYSEGTLLVIAPALNRPLQREIAKYRRFLRQDSPVAFASRTLEEVIEHVGRSGEPDYAQRLFERYCDWSVVHRELEAAFAVTAAVRRPSPNGGGAKGSGRAQRNRLL